MKYQLVVQFAAASTEDFDRLVAFEDRLIGELDDPAESFDKAHRVAADQGVPNAMSSAYRQVDVEDYVILWPSSLKEFKVL